MKRILMTGGNGFLGTRLKAYYQSDYEILSTDIDELDIVDETAVDNIVRVFKPDYIIHMAAIAETDFCNKNPEKCYLVNVTGTANIAHSCKRFGSKLVFCSTEQVFNGNKEPGPYRETQTPVPDTQYGMNKLEAETQVRKIIDEVWILRFEWMFGIPEWHRPVSGNLLWDVIKSLVRGQKIIAPRWEYRGITYVNQLVDQFARIFELPYDTYHLGSHNDLDRYDTVRMILEELGLKDRLSEILEADEKKYAKAPRDARLDTSKIRQFGIVFSDTPAALRQCLKDYGFL